MKKYITPQNSDNKIGTQFNYPSGMEWMVSSKITNGFNGKEKQETHGYHMYDFGFRHYDVALARWHVMILSLKNIIR